MNINLRITGLLVLVLTGYLSCDNTIGNDINNEKIELTIRVNNFIKETLKDSSFEDSPTEQTIEDLYVFLFPTSDTQLFKSYYISSANFARGYWNSTDKKIVLDLSMSEAGKRDVYVVANCSALKTTLDEVISKTELQAIFQSNDTPWSTTLSTPILMSGSRTHSFNKINQLNSLELVRATAKIQLNVTLKTEHQETLLSTEGTTQYKYRLIGFNKDTYVLSPVSKIDNQIGSSAWINWGDALTSYTSDSTGKLISLTLITYLNEGDNTEAVIEVNVPNFFGGALPPPELTHTYKLKLPKKIERNHWYIYNIEI